MWIRKEGAFEGIVPLDTFLKAQEVLAERTRRYSDDELLAHLKQLYADCGTLSGLIIDQAPGLPCAITYAQRFGSLTRAYELVGFHTSRDQGFIEINRRLRNLIASNVQNRLGALTGNNAPYAALPRKGTSMALA